MSHIPWYLLFSGDSSDWEVSVYTILRLLVKFSCRLLPTKHLSLFSFPPQPRVAYFIFMTMSTKCPESQRVRGKKDEDKTPLFGCGSLPTTTASYCYFPRASADGLSCCFFFFFFEVLQSFFFSLHPFETFLCESSKEIGDGKKRWGEIFNKEKNKTKLYGSWSSRAKTNKPQVCLMAGVDRLKEKRECSPGEGKSKHTINIKITSRWKGRHEVVL